MPPAPTPAPAAAPLRDAVAAPSWQRAWGESFRSAGALLAFLGLNPDEAPAAVDAAPAFPLRVPRDYAALMRRGDWNDPLLRQVLALDAERAVRSGFAADAVGDGPAQDGPAVLRKYRGRALLVLTGECAVHCRYCFRREYPYADQSLTRAGWDEVYQRLGAAAEAGEIDEILFSGGDPLSLSDAKLRDHFVRALALPKLRRLRLHTRVPVVLPGRVDDGLLALLAETAARKPFYLVLHVNHAREVSPALREKARALRATGVTLLNQSVLLRGVNDSADALEDLSHALLDAGILPYYLHQLDRVRGAHDFEADEDEGRLLMDALRARLPGYGVPRYVREVGGAASKMPL